MHQGDLAKYGEMVSSWHPAVCRQPQTCASRVRRGRAGGDRAPPPQRYRPHAHHAGACPQAQRLRQGRRERLPLLRRHDGRAACSKCPGSQQPVRRPSPRRLTRLLRAAPLGSRGESHRRARADEVVWHLLQVADPSLCAHHLCAHHHPGAGGIGASGPPAIRRASLNWPLPLRGLRLCGRGGAAASG